MHRGKPGAAALSDTPSGGLQAVYTAVLAPPAATLVEWLPHPSTQAAALAALAATSALATPSAGHSQPSRPLVAATALVDESRLDCAAAALLSMAERCPSEGSDGLLRRLLLSAADLNVYMACTALVRGVAARRQDSLVRWLESHWQKAKGEASASNGPGDCLRALSVLIRGAPAAAAAMAKRSASPGGSNAAVAAVASAACRSLLAYTAVLTSHSAGKDAAMCYFLCLRLSSFQG